MRTPTPRRPGLLLSLAGTLLLPLAAALGPAPAQAIPVNCSSPGQQRSPLKSLDDAARFYFDRSLAELDPGQQQFLARLAPGIAPCALTAGPASLGGKPGLLITLTYPSGTTAQAFCRQAGFQNCSLRSASGSQATPWAPGDILRREVSAIELEIQLRRSAPPELLGLFVTDPALVSLAEASLPSTPASAGPPRPAARPISPDRAGN